MSSTGQGSASREGGARASLRPADLLGLLVHDLRSPLAAAATHLQLLREEVQGEAASDVELAQSALASVTARLEETLQIRRLEAGNEPPVRERVNLSAALADAVESLRAVAGRRSVTTHLSVAGETTARLDPVLFRSALHNLLAHAVRHSPAGGEVQISLRVVGGAVDLEVADRGPSPTTSTDPQSRGAAGRNPGLGLYLAQLVARAHGGELELRDRDGGGAVLHFTLEAT